MYLILIFTFLFLSFIIIILNSFLDFKNTSILFYTFSLIFIFWIWYLIDFLRKDLFKSDLSFNWTNVLKYTLFFIIIIILYKFFDFSILNKIIILYLIFCLLFYIDSRISFLVALSLLSFVPIFIIMENKEKAEILSIYTYYFLVIWVVSEIYQNIMGKLFDNPKKHEE